MSSDDGVIVLREIANRLGLANVIAGPLIDQRNPTRVKRSFVDMLTARIIAIAADYEDCNDLDSLRADSAFKIGKRSINHWGLIG